jgi:hypothetical protein
MLIAVQLLNGGVYLPHGDKSGAFYAANIEFPRFTHIQQQRRGLTAVQQIF